MIYEQLAAKLRERSLAQHLPHGLLRITRFRSVYFCNWRVTKVNQPQSLQ
jgi:hypothetical protein